MTREKLLKILVAGCCALLVLSAGLLVCTLVSDTATSANRLAASGALVACLMALSTASLQLRRLRNKK